jgi:hypothetical protein
MELDILKSLHLEFYIQQNYILEMKLRKREIQMEIPRGFIKTKKKKKKEVFWAEGKW